MQAWHLWWEFLLLWIVLLWPALVVIAIIVGLQYWLAKRDSVVAGWHWLWGIILGITMVATLVPIQAWAERDRLVNRAPGEVGDAFAIVIIILLCIIVFKRPAETVHRDIRVVRPGAELEEDE
jgi:hypothetical protein